jgi:hypothetical protein
LVKSAGLKQNLVEKTRNSNSVAQAFQPVQMRVEGRYSINNPQFFKMNFIKNIKVIPLRFHPSSAQARKPVPPGRKTYHAANFLFDNNRLSGY